MIGIVSDVHGNLPALRSVLNRLDALGCTEILSLGDVVGYYAQPAECVDVLRERGIANILGNHDRYIVLGEDCPRSRVVSELLRYQRGVLSDKHVRWLAASRDYIVRSGIYFVHGGWKDHVDQYLYEVTEDDIPNDADIFFAGHTHVQTKLDIGGKTFCNPGSVGQPRDGDPRAAFALLSGNDIELHRVEYDIEETAFRMRRAGFPESYYKNLFIGAQIGGRIDKIVAA